MSIESMPSLVAAVGTPLALGQGGEIDRARLDVAAHLRRIAGNAKAAGVAAPDGDDNLIDDRDADGRTAWERSGQAADHKHATPAATENRAADATLGGGLDLIA
jgi:hypothetical protein